MATFDPASYLASLAKPRTLQELVAAGELIDCTLMAGWHGFQAQAFLSAGAWEAVIGPRGKVAKMLPPAELQRQGSRLDSLWRIASQQMARYAAEAKRGRTPPRSVPIHVPLAHCATLQRLEIRVAAQGSQQYLTVHLTGE